MENKLEFANLIESFWMISPISKFLEFPEFWTDPNCLEWTEKIHFGCFWMFQNGSNLFVMNLIQFCNFSISSLTIFLKNASIEHFQNWIRRQSREIRSEVVHVTSRDPKRIESRMNGMKTEQSWHSKINRNWHHFHVFASSLGRIPVSGTRDFIISTFLPKIAPGIESGTFWHQILKATKNL